MIVVILVLFYKKRLESDIFLQTPQWNISQLRWICNLDELIFPPNFNGMFPSFSEVDKPLREFGLVSRLPKTNIKKKNRLILIERMKIPVSELGGDLLLCY